MSDIPVTCGVEPFRYQSTPQPGADDGASGNQINEQALEDYLNRLRTAICEDLTSIFSGGDVLLSFLQLTDTPDTYAGASGFLVAVNGLQTGLEFVPPPTPPSNYFLSPRVIVMWAPTLAVTGNFGQAPLVVGAAQIVIPTNPGNTLLASYRHGLTAGTGAGANAGARSSAFQCIIGTAAPMGGFRLRWRFGLGIYNAGARGIVGLHPSTAGFPAIGAADPSTLTNVAFLGFDDTDTNWQIMVNDAAVAATKIDLGAGFALNATSLLELTLEIDPSGTDLNFTLRDLSLGTSTTGTVSTNLPAGGQPLTPVIAINSAATGALNRIDHVFMSIEAGPGE